MSERVLIVPMHLCMDYNTAEGFTTSSTQTTAEHSKLRDLFSAEKPARGDQVVFAWALNTLLKPKVLATGVLTETGARFAWMQTPLRGIALELEKGIDNKARWMEEDERRQLRDWLAGAGVVPVTTGFALQVQTPPPAATQKTLPLTPPPPAASTQTTPAPPAAPPLPSLPPTAGGSDHPRNVILHGPPGTGKTFTTAPRALELLRVVGVDKLDDAECAKQLRAFQAHGRAAFVTFHQSYGYEEFVEGLRPKLDAAGDVQYVMHEGIFVKLARAAQDARIQHKEGPSGWQDASLDKVWNTLLERAEGTLRLPSVKTAYDFVRRNDSLAYLAEEGGEYPVKRTLVETLWKARVSLGADPQTQMVAQAIGTRGPNPNAGVYAALWRETARLAAEQVVGPVPQFVLILDEINRGNISKIFGELITLLEPDKRLGMPHELTLPLAYSPGERFGVPPNLHLLGTMNTADRSIALLDVALRRRFEFEEVMPDPACIPRVLEHNGVTDAVFRDHVKNVLTVVNARIRFLLDREHQIGHAYLLGVRSYADLRMVFVTKVIPLLQEYFHGAWDRVCIVLGCPYTRPEGAGKPAPARKGHAKKAYEHPMMEAVSLSEVETIGFDHDEFDDRVEYVLNDTFRTSPDLGVLKLYFDELVAKPT